MIASILLDDNTELIKTTFFGVRAEQLLEMSKDELDEYYQMSSIEFLDSTLYYTKSTFLIGKEIMVLGKIIRNEFNNLLELNATSFTHI
jgi:hypothetical protein